jgi:hypothetical protein
VLKSQGPARGVAGRCRLPLKGGYDEAKKELFDGDGISGVYRRGPDYALVYKPPLKLATVAAGAAGAAATAGILALGGVKLHQWYNQPQMRTFKDIVRIYDELDGVRTQSSDQILDVPYSTLNKYQQLIDSFMRTEVQRAEYPQLRDFVTRKKTKRDKSSIASLQNVLESLTMRFAKQIVIIQTLMELQVSENEIRAMFGPDTTFKDIVEWEVWRKDGHWFLSDYLHALPSWDRALLDKFVAALEYDSVMRQIAKNSASLDRVSLDSFCAEWQQAIGSGKKQFDKAFEELRPLLPSGVVCEFLKKH